MINLGIAIAFSGYIISTVGYALEGKQWTSFLFFLYAISIPVIWMGSNR